MEIRPHAKIPSAYVGRSPPCHSLFTPVRDSLLRDTLTLSIVKGTIYSYACKVCSSSHYSNALQNFKCHENLFLRAIHLLTLILYSVESSDKSTQDSMGENFMLTDVHGISLTEIICDLHDSISKDDKLITWIQFLIQQLEALEPCREYIGKRFEKLREQTRLKVLPATVFTSSVSLCRRWNSVVNVQGRELYSTFNLLSRLSPQRWRIVIPMKKKLMRRVKLQRS